MGISIFLSGSVNMNKMVITKVTALIIFLITASVSAVEPDTRLINIRTGTHSDFIRIVLDSKGDRPVSIKKISEKTVDIVYKNLVLTEKQKNVLKQDLEERIVPRMFHDNGMSHLKFSSNSGDVRIKTFYLPSKNKNESEYRLVIDLYPQNQTASADTSSDSVTVPADKDSSSGTATVNKENENYETPLPEKAAIPKTPESVAIITSNSSGTPLKNDVHKGSSVTDEIGENSDIPARETAKPPLKTEISGRVEMALKTTDGEGQSSKFDEYSDKTRPLTGNIEIKRITENRSEIQLKMKDIGREDQNIVLKGERYGTAKIRAEYDELPHRYQYDARTLYSGIGTGILTLDDTLQGVLESTPYQDIDNRLIEYMNSAASGDPKILRRKGNLNIEWNKFDSLTFNFEVKGEKRDGTIPRFGSFGTGNTVEILEPVDYETMHIKAGGEYKQGNIYLSTSYYFSMFKNNNDVLLWDNPLALNDVLYNPSRGLIDLPPNNIYHNLSLSGYIRNLPFSTKISANVALGRMKQDDSLTPYTVNTAAGAPAVPYDRLDCEVETSLYNFIVTSNPYNSLNFKVNLKSYEHKNNTTPLSFPGFVDADDFFNDTPVINLPSSYRKNSIDSGIRMDILKNTRLAFNYIWADMKRTNREVSKQKDRSFKTSIDSMPLPWLNLRTSYEKMDRKIENYDFDSYLAAGVDLTQNPLLRKYDEADMNRDRVQLYAGITPWDKIGLSLSYIYGQDDFDKSTYGLLKDRHNIFSADVDFTFSQHTNFHAFYSREQYRNVSAGNGYTEIGTADWTVTGDDRINTLGGNFKTRLFIENLDLDLSYAYSKADGYLDFAVNETAYSDVNNVDNSSLHIFETEISYRAAKNWSCSLGMLWEKAAYSDYNIEGFTYVPSDDSDPGYYQGALLMGILPRDYDVTQFYFKTSFFF